MKFDLPDPATKKQSVLHHTVKAPTAPRLSQITVTELNAVTVASTPRQRLGSLQNPLARKKGSVSSRSLRSSLGWGNAFDSPPLKAAHNYIPKPQKGSSWPGISATLSGGITMNSILSAGGKLPPLLKAHLIGSQNKFDASGSLGFSNALSSEFDTSVEQPQMSVSSTAGVGEDGRSHTKDSVATLDASVNSTQADDFLQDAMRLPRAIQLAIRCLPESQRPEASTVCKVSVDQRVSFREALAICLVGATRCAILRGIARDCQETGKSLELQQWLQPSDQAATQMLAAVMLLMHNPRMDLNLEGCEIHDLASISVLSLWTPLQKLDLRGSKALQSIEGLRRCSNLERIDLSHCAKLRSVKCLLECPVLNFVNVLGSWEVDLDEVWQLAKQMGAQGGSLVWPSGSILWQQVGIHAKPRLPASQVVKSALLGAQCLLQSVLAQSQTDLGRMDEAMNYAKTLGMEVTDFQKVFMKTVSDMMASSTPDLMWLSKAPDAMRVLGMDPMAMTSEFYKIKLCSLLNAEDVALLLANNQSTLRKKIFRAAAVASWLKCRKQKKNVRSSLKSIGKMQMLNGSPLSQMMKKSDENGVSEEDFVEALSQIRYTPPAGSVESMFRFLDAGRDGFLSSDDFAKLGDSKCRAATVSELLDFLEELENSKLGSFEKANWKAALFGPSEERLNLQRFTEALQGVLTIEEEQCSRIFATLASKKDQLVSTEEFSRVGSLLGLYGYMKAQPVAQDIIKKYGSTKAAWKKADENNSESCSWDEYQNLVKKMKIPASVALSLWCILDRTNDGTISRAEWEGLGDLPCKETVVSDLIDFTTSINKQFSGLDAFHKAAQKFGGNAKGLTKEGFQNALKKWKIGSRVFEPSVLYTTLLDSKKQGIVQNLDPLPFLENELTSVGLSHFGEFLTHKYGSCEEGFSQLLGIAKKLRISRKKKQLQKQS